MTSNCTAVSPRQRLGWFWLAQLALAVSAGPLFSAPIVPQFDLHFPGLFDGPHLAVHGEHNSSLSKLSGPAGRVGTISGRSDRYSQTGQGAGYSGWILDVGTAALTRAGLYLDDPQEHRTEVRFQNIHGQAVGYTTLGSSVPAPDSAWFYDPATRLSRQIGLYAALGANDFPLAINDAGLVAGIWSSGTRGELEYVWTYDSLTNQNQQIGLTDTSQLGPGPHTSEFLGLSPLGHVVGTLRRTQSGAEGSAIWQYDHASGQTTRLGFFDGIYTSPSGVQHSSFVVMNDFGWVGGTSHAVSAGAGGSFSTLTGWVYNPATKTVHKAGLAQPGDESSEFRFDTIRHVSPTGFALGANGSESNRLAAWIHDTATDVTTRLGYFDAVHTLSGGRQISTIELFDDQGRVVGESQRALGLNGRSAWLYERSSGVTTQLGILDDVHFGGGPDGAHETQVVAMNEQGYIIGATRDRIPVSGVEFVAWVYNPVTRTTKQIGRQAAHTDLVRFNFPRAVNKNGQVVGGDDQTWWLFDPAIPRNDGLLIGPRDAGHGEGSIEFFNDAGYVIGYSERTAGISSNGQSAWFYDPAARQTKLLVFSESDGGRAYTSVHYLGLDGVVLGEYDLFDGGTLRGRRAFYWDPANGFHDVSNLIRQASPEFNWDGFLSSLAYIGPQLIAGDFRPNDNQRVPFVLRLVPEPTTLLQVIFAICVAQGGCLRRRRWRPRTSAGPLRFEDN